MLETVIDTIKSGQTRLRDHHTYNTRHRHNFTLGPHHFSLLEKNPTYNAWQNKVIDCIKTIYDTDLLGA